MTRWTITNILAMTFLGGSALATAPSSEPIVHDDRLEIRLFLEDPEIVTPIGLVVGSDDRIYVLESHTHSRPADYDGPEGDRVKVLVDRDGDGRCDEVTVFAEGLDDGMNLAVSPDGMLYIVCAGAVFALPDRDGDGRCDGPEPILEVISEERYDHNRLLSLVFDAQGWLYVGRGNMSSRAYTIRGTDGSEVVGYGDGGNIVRCRLDGSQVNEYATGFWNPFGLAFDRAGRLLCVDNDPDARGPNRLLHIVPGGDYGYRSLFGGGGNHPFQGWDGDLPGTLPMIQGTGEAPSGLIAARRTALPHEYRDAILVTVWNEHTIERHDLKPQGASVVAERSVLIEGPQDFRPVALAADRLGNLYVSDWVKVDYPNHGHGRIWRIAARDGAVTNANLMTPRSEFEDPVADPGVDALNGWESAADLRVETFIRALDGDDPFLRHAATRALVDRLDLIEFLRDHESPQVRLAVLLATQNAGQPLTAEDAARWLADQDLEVRRAALLWAGFALPITDRDLLDRAIDSVEVTGTLFDTYLAAVEMVNATFRDGYLQQAASMSRQIPRPTEPGLLLRIVRDETRPATVRARAVDRLTLDDLPRAESLLIDLADAKDRRLARAAVTRLAELDSPPSRRRLASLITDDQAPIELRIAALRAASAANAVDRSRLANLLTYGERSLRLEAARLLSDSRVDPEVRHLFEGVESSTSENDSRLASQVRFALRGPDDSNRPATLEAWQTSLATGGDPEAGRRVFLSGRATCTQCHALDGRGGALGPNLGGIGSSRNRDQIVRAILEPSEDFAPQYQAWLIATDDGLVHTGLQIDHKARGAIEMLTTEGRVVRFKAEQIEAYRASPQSIMPEGLEANLSVEEFRDLVAYLESAGRMPTDDGPND